jgi:hypothetical protein
MVEVGVDGGGDEGEDGYLVPQQFHRDGHLDKRRRKRFRQVAHTAPAYPTADLTLMPSPTVASGLGHRPAA